MNQQREVPKRQSNVDHRGLKPKTGNVVRFGPEPEVDRFWTFVVRALFVAIAILLVVEITLLFCQGVG